MTVSETPQLRPMEPDDLAGGLELSVQAGWNQKEWDWEFFYHLNPDDCFVYEAGSQIIGTVTSARYGNALSWVAMVLVHADRRRQGLGRGLLNAALESLSDCACVGLDATPSGRLVYDTLGFLPDREFVRLTADALAPVSGEISGVRAMTAADLDEAVQLDTAAFGVERRRVLEEFQRSHKAWVSTDESGTVSGFLLSRPGRLFHQLGPLTACDEKTARKLYAAARRELDGPLVMDVPSDEKNWIEYLCAQGFTEQRPFTRMFRGEAPKPTATETVFAISGPELG